jgi:hypothetical protein
MDEQPTAADVVRDGVEFTRWAWRSAGLIQLIAAVGMAMLFIAIRAPLKPAEAELVSDLGVLISLLAWAPLWTTLHRLALGGASAQRVRYGGLYGDRSDFRVLTLGWGFWVALLFSMLPLVAVSAGVFIVFRPLGLIGLGPLGHFQISFIIAALVWLAGMAGLGYVAARLAFAPAATISRKRLVIVEAWALTEGRVKLIAKTWALAQAPALLCLALLALADNIELQGGLASSSRWPMPDAILAGAVMGFVAAFIHAPLTAGILGLLYRRQRAGRAAQASATPPRTRATLWPAADREPLVRQGAIVHAGQQLDQGA